MYIEHVAMFVADENDLTVARASDCNRLFRSAVVLENVMPDIGARMDENLIAGFCAVEGFLKAAEGVVIFLPFKSSGINVELASTFLSL